MKISVNKFLLVIILPVLLSSGELCAQDYIKEQYDYSKELFKSEQYFDAITELKRLLFFDKSGAYNFEANYLIAQSYKSGARLNDAVKYFTISQMYARNDSLLFQAKLEVVKCNILRHTAGQSLNLLNQLERDEHFSNMQREIIYWKGWSYMFMDMWDEASLQFGKISDNHPLKELSDKVVKDKYSVSFAKVISYILPGSGQIYTGEYLSGLMSLGWAGLFGCLSAESFVADRVFDGFINSGLFLRFHHGNIQNAEKFAVEKNKRISDKALIYVQYNYKGPKP
ncbi:MAG: hypothetical protein WCJ01_08320 [Ignavibacteria bacterium]